MCIVVFTGHINKFFYSCGLEHVLYDDDDDEDYE